MPNETEEIEESLVFAYEAVKQANTLMRARIRQVYVEALEHAAELPTADGSARPRIVAFLQRLEPYKARRDMAGVGWLLAAMQERLNERNLMGWKRLKAIADATVEMLEQPSNSVH